MYNRYIGNTGKYTKVEEPSDRRQTYQESKPSFESKPQNHNPISSTLQAAKSILPHGLADGLKGVLKGILPDTIEIGDLLLILILLLLYIEKEDEEILIILGALIFQGFDK